MSETISTCPFREEEADSLLRLHKQMKEKEPSAIAVAHAISCAKEAGYVVGAKIRFILSDTCGVVMGYNNKTSGFYPGNIYPLLISSSRGNFEYALTDLTLI